MILLSRLSIRGDALYHSVLVKALAEGTWHYHIARLGAPFGLDAVDYPVGCTLDFAVIKILTAIVHNPFLSINLYWLLSITMAGAFAALFFRSLRISHLASASFGTLFAITPFVFYRNISHLHSVQFIVPAAAYLSIDLARGGVFGITENNRPSEKRTNPRRLLLVRLAICVAIGLTSTYWAFFACIVIAIACLIGLFRFGNKKIALVALLYVTVIGAASVANESGSLLYWYRNGHNKALWYKVPVEADIYGLRIRQMLTPIPNHPLPLMRSVRDKILAAEFPNDTNESRSAVLGTIGVIGFVILMLCRSGQAAGTHFRRCSTKATLRLRRRSRVNSRGRRVWQFIQRFCCSRIPRLQPHQPLYRLVLSGGSGDYSLMLYLAWRKWYSQGLLCGCSPNIRSL